LYELALFAGAGGGILGGKLLGWRTICAVEIDPYCRRVLLARQRDGMLKPFPIWDDVRTFDGHRWRGCVDVITGGFPCQDISAAGRGAGIDGERSGLWKEFARIIGEVRSRYVFVENSPMLTVRGLGRVLGDLAALGYDARWGVLGAGNAGAPHIRKRIWLLADANGDSKHDGSINAEMAGAPQPMADAEPAGLEGQRTDAGQPEVSEPWNGGVDHANGSGREQFKEGHAWQGKQGEGQRDYPASLGAGWWESEPDVGRVAHGVASRVGKLRALGNGQVPAVAALAWRTLSP
jgi:DNA (cytosine-5)-methyltransferase 1